MTGIGLFFGISLAVAHRLLHVEEDPRIDMIEGMLPGSNCGACGEAGCRAFAESVIAGVQKPSGCTVSSPEGIETIAAFLGVDAGRTGEARGASALCGRDQRGASDRRIRRI